MSLHLSFFSLTDSTTDFTPMNNVPLLFSPSQQRKCVTIPIQDDDMVEKTEGFTIRLRRTPDLDEAVKLVLTYAFVVIINDDGEPSIPICYSILIHGIYNTYHLNIDNADSLHPSYRKSS